MSTSATAQGQELIDERKFIDTCEAAWLSKLAIFDSSGVWQEDGHATCAAWLVDRCEMGRSTAKDKLHVAHELERRPVIAVAFAAGNVSYAKVRALTRLEGLDDVRDAKYLRYAADDTKDVLERRVQRWNYYANQDKPPSDLNERRGIRRVHGFGGEMGRLTIDALDDDIDRVLGVLDAYLDYLFHRRTTNSKPVDEASGKPYPQAVLRAVAGSGSEPESVPLASAEFVARFETAIADETPAEQYRSLPQRRLDAWMDLIEEIALVRDDQIDVERAAIGVTVDYETLVERARGSATLESGRIISGEAARRLACDAGIVRLITKGVSEILDVGRKTRTWTWAQRRAHHRARHAQLLRVPRLRPPHHPDPPHHLLGGRRHHRHRQRHPRLLHPPPPRTRGWMERLLGRRHWHHAIRGPSRPDRRINQSCGSRGISRQ